MTYDEAKARRDILEARVKRYGDELGAFPKLANGLTPDSVKNSPAWQHAYSTFHLNFDELRNFNRWFVSAFAYEIREERRRRQPA